MSFHLPKLPYAYDALAPLVSKDTLHFHHDKHHRAYVDKLNKLVAGTELADKPIEDVILATAKDDSKKNIFNNAAQHWNHAVFWHCMAPGGGEPQGELRERIDKHFGSLDAFKEKFVKEGVEQFGSGWVWLVDDGSKLAVRATHDAMTPLADGQRVLITCDVWEHAYYLDYKNEREKFLKAFIDNLANWDYAASCLRFDAQEKPRKTGTR
jgi:Fe-Mn family superoxide dismutase